MLLLCYTYHTAITAPPFPTLLGLIVCCPAIDRRRYVILQSTNCITNIFAVHGFNIYTVCLLQEEN